MTLLDAWREWAKADAEARGYGALAPLIDSLATSLHRLRAVDWHEELHKQPRRESGGS